jgi:transposase
MNTKPYPTDLTDPQWLLVEPILRGKPGAGRPRRTDLRRVFNAILYVTNTGCAWRMLPHDFPPWQTVYYHFARWSRRGVIQRVHDALREQVRAKNARGRPVRTAAVDSQTSDSAGARQDVGYDGGKRIEGRKRHIVVDSLGMLLAVLITAASVTDAKAAGVMLGRLRPADNPLLKRLYADGAYGRERFPDKVKAFNGGARLELIRRKKGKKGWQLLPKRWLVERTFGWLTRNRRLCRSYEHTAKSAESFVYLSMIRLMANRLRKRRNRPAFNYRRTA